MPLRTRPALAAFLLLVFAMPVSGAKFPAAVEKPVILIGDAAVAAAALFGLSAANPTPVSLPLGRADSWAIYLLKQDTAELLYNDEHMPPRHDTVAFSATPAPRLAIAPFWLDLGTGLPDPRPGHYAIGSAFLPEALDGDDPWTRIVRRLRAEPGWRDDAFPRAKRCFTGGDGAEVCFVVYGSTDYPNNVRQIGYVAGLEARPK